MTALEALRKIEHTKVEYDVYLPDMGLYDEDGNLYAVKVCAGFFGFDDEFEEVERALNRLEELEVSKASDMKKYRDALSTIESYLQDEWVGVDGWFNKEIPECLEVLKNALDLLLMLGEYQKSKEE